MNAKMIAGRKKYQEMRKAGQVEIAKRPSMVKAIKAKCKDCMQNYIDGRNDCVIESCILYYWMPYGKIRKQRISQKGKL